MEGKKTLLSKIAGWGPLGFIMGKIRNKLLVAILVTSLAPLITVAIINYTMTAQSLEDQGFAALKLIQTRTASETHDFFEGITHDMHALAESPYVVEAADSFLKSARETGLGNLASGVKMVRDVYLNKSNLTKADDNSAYSEIHAGYHTYFHELLEIYGLKDIYIVDEKEGNILYSVTKKDPLGTSLVSGPYANEALGRIYRKMERETSDVILFEDFTHSRVFSEPTGFFATHIHAKYEGEGVDMQHKGDEGHEELIMVVEISIAKINELMTHEQRIGETDEMYLIGPEGQWRNESRFKEHFGGKATILNPDTTIKTEGIAAAQAGKKGSGAINSYRNTEVLSVWEPFVVQEPTKDNPEGLVWTLVVEMEHEEIDAPAIEIRNITVLVIVGAIAILVLTAVLISGGMVKQVNAITGLFSEIGMGDFDARAEVLSVDELGELASSLNIMLDNILTLIQSQEERDAIQESIKELLEEVAAIADGDLTIEAKVKDDITGSIADSFNFMIQQLRDIIRNVQDATLQVSSSANEIQTTAEHLAQGSESQASQILDTTAAIDEMAVSIQQVSENAALSATVGEQAKVNSQQGAKAVQDTIAGMNKIRNQVQETSKRIKRLGESSQEIGDIVQLIGDIADRTSILALNASIQAAMAGEAGRGFAVVAEEVERLAERSTNATKQIDGLIKTIQSEVGEAVTAMEVTTEEVVGGSQVADQAGRALVEIEGVSNRLSELIQSISLSAKQQARGSEALAGSMNEIADVTQQTAAGTKQAAVSINNLAHLADELRASLSTFKLPDNGGNRRRG